MTREEARIAMVLLGLMILAVWLAPETPGPGPLGLLTAAVAVHAALVAPAMVRRGGWALGFVPCLLALPALASTAYGHPLPLPALAVVALCCASGAAARAVRSPFYLPSMVLVFAAPFFLHYLVLGFGAPSQAGFWKSLSPLSASAGWPSAPCVVLMLAWPVWALARRRA